MSRDWLLFLDDLVEAAEKIIRLTDKRDFDAFTRDEGICDAVLMNLLVLGEATKCLPDTVLAEMPGVDWSGVAGLRDIIAHHYFGVDQALVWDIVRQYVPPLLDIARAYRERTVNDPDRISL